MSESSSKYHDSFEGGLHPDIETYIWGHFSNELEHAETDLTRPDYYTQLKVRYLQTGQLNPTDSAFLAKYEASALFLAHPDLLFGIPRAYNVMRTTSTLRYMGLIDQKHTQGNILLTGSGDPFVEHFGVRIKIDVTNPYAINHHAPDVINALKSKIDSHKQPEPTILARGVNITIPMSPSALTVAFDPSQEIAEQVRLRFRAVVGDQVPPIRYSQQTLGDFLDNTPSGLPTSYSLIAAFRTDPEIWTGNYPQIHKSIKTRMTNNRKFQTLLINTQREINNLVDRIGELKTRDGKIVVTVGAGHEDETGLDTTSRLYLMEFLSTYPQLSRATKLDSTRAGLMHIPNWPTHECDMEAVVFS